MANSKKQHYVPQFLLRRFCARHQKTGRLWVLDKREARVYPASVRDVAHENLFYEYHDEAMHIELEGLMQRIDSRGAQIVSKIIQEGRLIREPRSYS